METPATEPDASIYEGNRDGRPVWENDAGSECSWSASHQLVSVPDESDWIIFGDERRAPAGVDTWVCMDLASFKDDNKLNKSEAGAFPLHSVWLTLVNEMN